MSSLEDLLPEMAGVFAAQESALDNCVAILSTQLQRVAADGARSAQRVHTLEASERALRRSLAELQASHDALVQQQQAQTAVVDALRLASSDLSGLETLLAAKMEAQATTIIHAQLSAMETKMAAQVDARLLEAAHRAYAQTQQSEDATRAQLEMLEKKFDFLSKIKMEIKDLGKRIERQDQTLDDMRTGLSLLAKSVGTDEIDDESDHEDKAPVGEDEGELAATTAVPVLVLDLGVVPSPEPAESTPKALTPVSVDEAPATAAREPEEVVAVELPVTELVEVLEPIVVAEEPAVPDENPQPTPAPEVTVAEVETPPPEEVAPVAPVAEPVVQVPTPAVEATGVEEPMPPPPMMPTEVVDATAVVEEQPPIKIPETAPETTTPIAEAPTPTPPAPAPTPLSAPEYEQEAIATLIDTPAGEDEEQDTFQAPAPQVQDSDQITYHPPTMQHMSTAPNLSAVALSRTRRLERLTRRQLVAKRDAADEQRDTIVPTRVPLSRDAIRLLWQRVFNKIIQLRRLQSINGTSPEKTLFRRQNLSMGARVKRLEETATDLEDMVEALEGGVRGAAQGVQALQQQLALGSAALDKRARKLDDGQQMQARGLLAVEEKIENLENELRKVRNVSRRDSAQNSVSTAAFTQIATQLHDMQARLHELAAAHETHNRTLQRVTDTDMPALGRRLDHTVHELHGEVDLKTKELSKTLTKAMDSVVSAQTASAAQLHRQLANTTDQIYRDLLVLTSAILFAVELMKQPKAGSGPADSPTKAKRARAKTPLAVAVGLLQTVVATFEASARPLLDNADSAPTLAVLFDKLDHFRQELVKAQEQADKLAAMAAANAAASTSTAVGFHDSDREGSGPMSTKNSSPSPTSSLEEHLVIVCTQQLRTFEGVLVAQSPLDSADDGMRAMSGHVTDFVIQLRAVLFLLGLHAQLAAPQQQLQSLQRAQSSMQHSLTEHDFALTQLGTIEAVVKTMNARLDSFVELTFSFAKDADVKHSVQDVLNAHEELREQLGKQVEGATTDAAKRDELLEREVTQLVGRVNKKLDKDEMLWTQEVLERRLQGVANAALSEDDLVDIQRALRNKLDKAQFQALLQQQHAKMLALGGGGDGDSLRALFAGGAGGQALAAAKCISCNNELPPTKPELHAAVKEEVQQEVARVLARQHQQLHSATPAPASPTFNASNHRSMDKHKKELLLAALQQKNAKK